MKIKTFPYLTLQKNALLLVFSLFGFACTKLPKDNYTFIAGLIKLSYKAPPTVASQYPNITSGFTASIQGASALSSATSSAISSSNTGATTLAANIVEPALKDAIRNSKSLTQARVNFNSTTTCNGTTQTVTGIYTTASQICLSTTGTTTVCPTQPSSQPTGSYTITPNITTKITFSCTYPTNLTTSYTQTLNATYTITGSLQIVFTNATIKYLDIDAFTKTAATTYKTTTLSGNISVSNINQSITGSTTAKYTSTTGQTTSTITNYSSYSDNIATSNLVVDSAQAATLNLAESGIINSSQTLIATTGSSTSCYSAGSYESGVSASGSYNGLAVSTSYNLTTQDYIKMLSASSSTITLCQSQGGSAGGTGTTSGGTTGTGTATTGGSGPPP